MQWPFSWNNRKLLPQPTTLGRVLLLMDWDNFEICLRQRFGPGKMQIDQNIKKLINWVKSEVGELSGGYGWVFAPEHLNQTYRNICAENNLRMITCPKKHLAEPRRNPKSRKMETDVDTVDETIIWYGKWMLQHPDIQFICIASGDSDYLPLMEAAKKHGIKVAFAAPSVGSLSKQTDVLQDILRLVDIHPTTQKKMFVRLDEL